MTDLSQPTIPQNLSVTLSMTEEIRQQITSGASYLSVAQAYEIDDSDTAQLAASELTNVKRRIVTLETWRDKFVEPAKQIMENARALFNPGLAGLQQSETLLKQRLLDWDTKERQRIAAENAEREASARKTRQEAEAKAAAERARAEQQAAEARRAVAEAEERRKKAEAEGNARAAAAAAADAAKATEKAAAALENGNAKAAAVEIAAAAQCVATPIVEQQKIAGFSTRENYVAKLLPGTTEEQAKALIVAACATRPELLAMLKLDTSALAKMAKALKTAFNVPGYEAKNEPIAAGSRG